MIPDGDGTNAGCQWTNSGVQGAYEQVDESPETPDTGDYIWNKDSADSSIFLTLTATPGDFVSMDQVSIWCYVSRSGFVDDTCLLYAQLFQADETSPLSDEVTVVNAVTNGERYVAFTGEVASNKATWDEARLKLRWDYNKSGQGDDGECRCNAVRVCIDAYNT